MKRGGPIERRAPLKTKTPLRVKKPSTAGGHLRRREIQPRAKRQKSDFTPGVKKAVRARSGGWCEFPGCDRSADHFHHRLMRSHGGPGTVENCAHLCQHHHDHVHANPAESYRNGMLVRGVT